MAHRFSTLITGVLIALLFSCLINLEAKHSVKSIHRRSYNHRRKNQDDSSTNIVKAQSNPENVFITSNNTIVTAQAGGTAILPCIIRKSNTGVVSWIRRHDYRLLTVGLLTYIADNRFMVEHIRHLQNWGLLIKPVRSSDAGLYECQVSLHPSSSIFVELKVTKVVAEILGAPDLHLNAGSTLQLVCSLIHSTEPPTYVFWYHESRMINYDSGVTVLPNHSSSVLLVHDVDKSHNGNYTCSPSNAKPSSIYVHVLNATAEEQPAAMQHANASISSTNRKFFNFCLIWPVLIIVVERKRTR
ncbi:netrin receptor DCC-like [Agrilus planipennis]|uniref:Netrin receptor DCC-like n=1 Tax=Agrilus planipennis TaxID=224129 RepID=A0A1W4WX03_AGRPL|nr:netrin receptor DCC-like [Agrilus planipennis]XP_018325052.1 netrin receptor DCC-like [Agrilus planipennis]